MSTDKSDAAPQWGPKMAALTEKQRKFVIALYSPDAPRKGDKSGTGGLLGWAATQAKHHMKAINAIMDRADPIPRQPMAVVVNSYQAPTLQMTQELVKEIAEIAARAGVQLPPAVIEGEAIEVEEP